ncbi:MAG: XdhC family protein [Actinomycetota bacterium]|nr:XdhC family protein [Actinomycetota bacterium]
MSDPLSAIQGILDAEEFGSVITFVDGPSIGTKVVLASDGTPLAGTLPPAISSDVTDDAIELMNHEQHRTMSYGSHSVFFESLAPPPDLLVFGAVHVAQALTTFATRMGYRVTVVDSRPAFATPDRFPEARAVLVGWPADLMDQLSFDRRTWVVILSHDTRHETPVLEAALRSEARYIGAMGSRRTHKQRVERLHGMGFVSDDTDRIRGPVGLDIGAETPQEVAVSILAEMTLIRYGAGTGLSLHGQEGRIHKQRPEDA